MRDRDSIHAKVWQVSMFLQKHNIRYRKRKTNFKSVYFEIELDRIRLIRISDHHQLSADNPWEPDWSIVLRRDYEQMKRAIKKINMSLYYQKVT